MESYASVCFWRSLATITPSLALAVRPIVNDDMDFAFVGIFIGMADFRFGHSIVYD